jgi:hypothetical protein
MKSYPTKSAAVQTRSTRTPRDRKTAIDKCRTPQEPPTLFVLGEASGFTPKYCRAHLRNMRGYLVLQWRDGARVRSYYLGKARKSSPTAGEILENAGARPAASGRRSVRRIK